MGQPLADAARQILLKSPALWTEDEVRAAMRGDDYIPSIHNSGSLGRRGMIVG
jgi:hypothetical protein